jgi:hypothetical protein
MFFVEHDHVVRTLAPRRTDQALNKAILPGRAEGRRSIPNAHRWERALNTAPNARSLSRMRYFGAVSHGNASVIWRTSHSSRVMYELMPGDLGHGHHHMFVQGRLADRATHTKCRGGYHPRLRHTTDLLNINLPRPAPRRRLRGSVTRRGHNRNAGSTGPLLQARTHPSGWPAGPRNMPACVSLPPLD